MLDTVVRPTWRPRGNYVSDIHTGGGNRYGLKRLNIQLYLWKRSCDPVWKYKPGCDLDGGAGEANDNPGGQDDV